MSDKPARSVTLPTRILYGTGSVADGVKNTTFNTFLLFFYTQVVGLSGSMAGAAIFIALLVDAVTDPLLGSISDNFRSRWGRRHPFIYASAAPMALCFIALFNPPEVASQTSLFLWMLAFTVGVRVSMTLYAVPSSALVAEMTPVYDERTSLVSFRVLFGWIGGIVTVQVGYLVFFAPSEEFADGRLDFAAYGDYALAGAIAIFCAIMICGMGTHRLIPNLHENAEGVSFTFRGFVTELKDVFSNRAYLVLVFAILTIATATGFTDNMGLYVNTYFWELSTAQIAVLVYGALIGTLAAFMLTSSIAERTDKRTTAIIYMAGITFLGPLPVCLRLLGLMPDNGHPALVPILFFWTGIIVFVAVGTTILVGSMIADIIDQSELKSGKRQEGMFNAAFALTSKATSGLGGLIAGIALDVVAFPAGAEPGEVDPETIYSLGLAVGPGILLFWIIALVIIARYPMTRAEHTDIIRQLNERRSEA